MAKKDSNFDEDPDLNIFSSTAIAGASSLRHQDISRQTKQLVQSPFEYIIELREHDIPYIARVAIDLDLRIGSWFDVAPLAGEKNQYT